MQSNIKYGFCGDIDPLYRGVLVGATDAGNQSETSRLLDRC